MHYKRFQAVLLAAALTFTSLFAGVSPTMAGRTIVAHAAEAEPKIEEDYESGSYAAKGRGAARLEVISDDAHAGEHSLKVTGRTSTWNGVIWSVSAFAGRKIKISAWVKSQEPEVKLTAEHDGKYPGIATVKTGMDEWTHIEGEFEVTSTMSNPGVYLEAPNGNGDIYVDDFQIVSLGEIKEPPALGKEIVKGGDMEEGLENNWKAAGEATIAASKEASSKGETSALVSGRTTADSGIAQDLTGYLKKGSFYGFSADVKGKDAASAGKTYQIVLSTGGETLTDVVVGSAKLDADGFTKITGEYTIPKEADLTNAILKICSEEDLGDFYVDEVSVAEQVGLSADGIAKKIGNSNPLSDGFYGADPFAMAYDGRVYVYMTNDSQQFESEAKDANGFANKDNGYGNIATIKVISSDDMVNWTDHGEIPVAGKNAAMNPDGIAKWAGNSWAPAAAHKTIDGKEKFFLYFADNGSGIGVLEADSPVGPFREPDVPTGSRLVAPGTKNAQGVTWLFDPAVFVDDDGTGYLYYGGGVPNGQSDHPNTARVLKLKDNMVEADGDAVAIDAPGLFEDSGIHKYGDKYYYSYCSNFDQKSSDVQSMTGSGNICCMVSDNPMGPFTFSQQIFVNQSAFFGVGGNNHHCVFNFNDKWYLTYHAQTLGKAVGKANGYRSTHIDELEYNEDGSIKKVTGTYEGVGQLKNFDPYQRIEAETIAWQSGIKVAKCEVAGGEADTENRKLTNVKKNSWVSIASADFGKKGTKEFKASIASETGSQIEIHLDSVDSDPVATLTVEPTGSNDTFKEMSWEVGGIKGVHHVFLVFKGDSSSSLEMDYYSFTEKLDKESLKADLNTAVGSARGMLDKLKDTEKETLQKAIEAAEEAAEKEEVTVDELSEAVNAIEAAVDTAKKEVEANEIAEKNDTKAALEAEITATDAMLEKLTDADKTSLQSAIDTAKKVAEKENATLDELKAAAEALSTAKAAAQKVIDAANNSKEDTKPQPKPQSQVQTPTTTVDLKAYVGKTFTDKAGFTYKITECSAAKKTVALTKVSKQLKSIKVPDTAAYENMTFAVTEIGKGAFKNQKKATKAVIGKNVTAIGASAFSGCKQLGKVTIKSADIVSIGKKAFSKVKKNITFKVPKKNKKAYDGLLKKAKTKNYKVK
ncbi:MAG: carbohydrate-binding protein [Lachnospiraceae bacterium]|nr:carbohydrate-binding protein [Lachnospiraceae bacterium]